MHGDFRFATPAGTKLLYDIEDMKLQIIGLEDYNARSDSESARMIARLERLTANHLIAIEICIRFISVHKRDHLGKETDINEVIIKAGNTQAHDRNVS